VAEPAHARAEAVLAALSRVQDATGTEQAELGPALFLRPWDSQPGELRVEVDRAVQLLGRDGGLLPDPVPRGGA